jgi:hypothetical protein
MIALPMTSYRRRDLRVALTELGFAVAAFGCGLYDAPLWATGLAAAGMLAYWSWSRRAVLKRLHGAAWATVSTVALVAIIAIQAGAYWLGLVSGGYV